MKREKFHFQCGGAWPFSVANGVHGLVHPINARFVRLLNRVKYDSSLISFSAPWQVNSFLNFCESFILCSYSFYLFFCYAVSVSNFSELFSYAATVFFFGINSA